MLGIGYHLKNSMEPYEVIRTDTITNTKTDTLWRDTTITKTKTKVKYIQVIKTDTVYDKQGNEIELLTDNKTYIDTITCAQKDTAIVTSYISGVNARLDSLRVEMKKSEVIKTNTITIEKYIKDNKRFNVGVQTGMGYGFTSKQIEPYIGFGIQINL
jgi:adenylyl- and sulfurtransferase ThiI